MEIRFLDAEMLKNRKRVNELYKLIHHLSPNDERVTPKSVQWRLLNALATKNCKVIICVDEKEGIVGTVSIYFKWKGSAYVAELEEMVRHPAKRGRGIGELLIKKFLELAWAEPIDYINLESRFDRFDAHALYMRHGFIKKNSHVYRIERK